MRKTNERAASGSSQTAASRINAVQGGDIAGGDRIKSTVRIPFAQIEIGAGTQARTRIDNALAEEYAEAMRDGAFFPPVIVFSDVKNTYLADGFHRVEAARRCGFLNIDAIVEQGTARDALWYALGANKAHGLRMSRADVRRAIELALQEFPDRSSRDIAKQIGCDHKTVEAARQTQESGGEIPHVDERVGADGKTYPAHRKLEPAVVVGKMSDGVEQTPDDSADQPVERVPKPVGLARAQQALDLLRSIPNNDPERPLAISLISAWLREVQTTNTGSGSATGEMQHDLNT